jgi:two-component system nitrogen regulation response regulator GlnG
VVKPLDPAPLRETIGRAFEISRLMRVPARVADPAAPDDGADVLVGNCPAMQEVYKAIGRIASQNVTVLLLGESGTGKELVARAIYNYSNRAQGPFLAVNCAAIPETLLESELFGHEKGAFSGAERKRVGKFEQCHGGTLFLDEVGDMTPLTQAKILRVLQDGRFERVGGGEVIHTDVRVIAATNRDLGAMMDAAQFRSDLYYRLNVFTIRLPPLRERGEDLPLLANHFLQRFNREFGKDVESLSPDTIDLLRQYPWPGNVRELQSVLKQAILQASGPVLVPDFLSAPIRGGDTIPSAAPAAEASVFPDLERFVQERLRAGSEGLHSEFQAATECLLFLQVLRHTQNNLTQAARILGISRVTLRSKLNALGLSIDRSTSVGEENT